VVHGWENLDRSPNLYLARVPGIRRALARANLLSAEQASAVFPSGIVRADLRRGVPYPSRSAAYVYSSHMIGSLSRDEARGVLTECWRVLAPGGVIRLATPDLRRMIENYWSARTMEGMTPADTLMHGIFGPARPAGGGIQGILRRLLSPRRRWAYDADSLRQLLCEAGFANVTERTFRMGSVPDLGALEHYRDSLFMEARRPG
jgi:hypothetical protein